MPLLVIHTNDRGDVASVGYSTGGTLLEQFNDARRGTAAAQNLGREALVLDATIFQLGTIHDAIVSSPILTDEQRTAALGEFNKLKPGDRFAFVADSPIIRQGGDVGVNLPPIIHVFVDP